MSLLDIRDDPDYVNANEATKQAIFEKYSADDKHYTGANEATQAEIRKQFGLGGAEPVAENKTEQVEKAPGTPEPAMGPVAPEGDLTASALQSIAPAAFSPNSTGLANLGRAAMDVGKNSGAAYIKAAIEPAIAAYKANPFKAGAIDLVSGATTGLPLGSMYNSFKDIGPRAAALKEAAQGTNAALSKVPPNEWASAISQGGYPAAADAFRDLRTVAGKLDPTFSTQLREALNTGSDPAVKKLLANAPDALKNNPAFAAQAEKYLAEVPGMGTKAMRVLGPIARGAGRVLGPVGAAMNLYDAGQMARDTQLGQRLASGEGQMAQHAFRNMNPGYGAGFNSTLTPDQAEVILKNGSPRDIQAFGGQAAIQALIKQKAAAQALKPIAPGP